jgi:hypothetical protein
MMKKALLGVVVLAIIACVSCVLYARSRLREKKASLPAWTAYQDYEKRLYRALTKNDFAWEYSTTEDRERLAREFAFLKDAPNQDETVVRLARWIAENTKEVEIPSVRAVELYEKKSGACEIHAFAVGVLESLGIKARWISGAKSSLGFGYLEAFADGQWRLYRLRDPTNQIRVGKSAWALFKESEPSLNVRTFYGKAGQAVHSWNGAVYPAVFPLANARYRPELEALFTTDKGVAVDRKGFNPHVYMYAWWSPADADWVKYDATLGRFARG